MRTIFSLTSMSVGFHPIMIMLGRFCHCICLFVCFCQVFCFVLFLFLVRIRGRCIVYCKLFVNHLRISQLPFFQRFAPPPPSPPSHNTTITLATLQCHDLCEHNQDFLFQYLVLETVIENEKIQRCWSACTKNETFTQMYCSRGQLRFQYRWDNIQIIPVKRPNKRTNKLRVSSY